MPILRCFVVLCSLLPMLVACNTVEGFGKDIKKGGQAIERSASKHK